MSERYAKGKDVTGSLGDFMIVADGRPVEWILADDLRFPLIFKFEDAAQKTANAVRKTQPEWKVEVVRRDPDQSG